MIEQAEREQNVIVQRAWLIAFTVYLAAIYTSAVWLHRETHAVPLRLPEAPMLEAELVKMNEPAHLSAPLPAEKTQPPEKSTAQPEQTVSKSLGGDQKSQAELDRLAEQNNKVTAAQSAIITTRGPQVISAPPPKIPAHLKNEAFKGSVLIEFWVSATGESVPSLIGSSGNAELDAIALKTAKSWTFKPALKDGQNLDSKVRLRINFEVE